MVLVTGASGLLGSQLVKQLLAEGHHVRALYNKTIPVDLKGGHVQLHQCDILDVIGLEEAMKDISEVYHCAGLVSFLPGEERQLYKVNIEGTANIVNAAIEAGIRKMVHVSSVSAMGRGKRNDIINEEMLWTKETSNSKYGHSKYLGEMEVWRGIAEGLQAVIVNPTIILGAGNWNEGSTEIFKSVYNEFPWYSNGVTGFVDVTDVVDAMILLMKSDVVSERFIINAENISYRNVFNLIAKAFNKKAPSRKVTPFLAAVVWRWEALKNKFGGPAPLVTRETAETALENLNYDNSKFITFFPHFFYKPFSTTVTDTCKALQQKVNNH